jgi:hypothetical protein
MPTETRSPWSREKGQPHPRLAESPGSRSNPSNARADWGHAAHNIGKGGQSSIYPGRTDGDRAMTHYRRLAPNL